MIAQYEKKIYIVLQNVKYALVGNVFNYWCTTIQKIYCTDKLYLMPFLQKHLHYPPPVVFLNEVQNIPHWDKSVRRLAYD